MEKTSVLIVGTGAMGTLFAARLASVGIPVTVLGNWHEGLAALRAEGAGLITTDGITRRYPVHVVDSSNECAGAQLALVMVKAWQTQQAARQLFECLGEQGLAVTLQNGLGNLEVLSDSLGIERTALGVTTTGATLVSPGLVRAGGEGAVSIEAHPRLKPLVEALRAASFKVNVVTDARSLAWGKLVINAVINPLTALLHVPNGELLEHVETRALMGVLARETAAVAAAEGVALPFDDPVTAAEDVAQRTAANHSSMLQDIQRGAPTEIDAICGEIVRRGEDHNVPVPVNWSMWQLVKSAARQREPASVAL